MSDSSISNRTFPRIDFNQSLDALMKKHPELDKFTLGRISDLSSDNTSRDIQNIADHVDASWSSTYQVDGKIANSRFIYTAGYLDWILGSGQGHEEKVFTVMDDDNIAGLAFFVPRTVKFEDDTFDSGILTGISINPSYSGQGVMQLLTLYMKDQIFKDNGDKPYFIWWDNINDKKGHSLTVFKEKDPTLDFVGAYPLLYKMFDSSTATDVLDIPFYEKPLVKLLSGVKHSIRANVRPMDEDLASEGYDKLLASPDSSRRLQRVFSKSEFVRQATYQNDRQNDDFSPIHLAYTTDSGVQAMLLGYRIPVKQKGTGKFMFVDNLISNDHLSNSELRRFLTESEAIANEEYNAFGACYLKNMPNSKTFQLKMYMSDFPHTRALIMGISSPYDLPYVPGPKDASLDHK